MLWNRNQNERKSHESSKRLGFVISDAERNRKGGVNIHMVKPPRKFSMSDPEIILKIRRTPLLPLVLHLVLHRPRLADAIPRSSRAKL